MNATRWFVGPIRPAQRLCLSQPIRRSFTVSTARHPRARTSVRTSPARDKSADLDFESFGNMPARKARDTRGEDELRRMASQPMASKPMQRPPPPREEPARRQQESQSLRINSETHVQHNPTTKPPKPGRMLSSTRDIWSAQSLYLETASSSSRSSLRVSLSSSAATTAATSFFAASRPTFLYSSAQLRTTPPNSAVPEIAIIGASNVGKSTFLNALAAGLTPGREYQEQLARTSARAGHTRTMNAYAVGPSIADDHVLAGKLKKRLRLSGGEEVPRHSLVLVDTPGYGFRSQKEWGDGIIGFLEKRTMLKGVVVLVAAEKGGLGQFDREVLRMVAGLGKGVLIVVTKGDKLVKGVMDLRKKAKKDGVEAADEQNELHRVAEQKLRMIEGDARRACRLASGGTSLVQRVYLTAADMHREHSWMADSKGSNRGIGGARAAILELAGLADLGVPKPQVTDDVPPEKRAETASPEAYSGETISFEELEKMYEKQKKG